MSLAAGAEESDTLNTAKTEGWSGGEAERATHRYITRRADDCWVAVVQLQSRTVGIAGGGKAGVLLPYPIPHSCFAEQLRWAVE